MSRATLSNIFRTSSWVLIPATIALGDFVFRHAGRLPPNLEHSPTNLLGSLLLSLVFWWALSRLVAASERRWVWACAVAFPAASIIAAVWHFNLVVGLDPPAGAATYLFQEPASSFRMMSGRLSLGIAAAISGLGGLWALVLGMGPTTVEPGIRRSAWMAFVPWVMSALLWPSNATVGQSPFTADFHASHVLSHSLQDVVSGSATRPLGVAHRADLEPVDDKDNQIGKQTGKQARPNVIVFLAESLRRDRMQVWGHDRQTTPRMARFFEEHSDEVYRFERAVTGSAFTDLSVPMVLTGLSMARDRQTMHTAPMLWHYAQAVGAQTFLVSSQQWAWRGLDEFMLLDRPPDHVITAETIGTSIVNDVGVDDRLAAEQVVEVLTEELAEDRPFLGVVQTNTTHFPFLPKEDVGWSIDDPKGRYDASVALTDAFFGDMVDALEATGRADDTVILFVADHSSFFYRGQNLFADRQIDTWQDGLRVRSCHPMVAAIPMFMYLPDKWADRLGVSGQTVRANTSRVTSTLDVVPTVLDLWGVDDLPAQAGLEGLDRLDGHSLLAPIAPERTAHCVNTVSWGLRPESGFAVFGTERVVYGRRRFGRLHVYDANDPTTWSAQRPGEPPTEADRGWLDEVISDTPILAPYLEYVEKR
ncbi:LTA synthase family protein [Persicimonas caeni]|uniref:LTA synthase family protein n=1 Tax=Persicimonas caeni TaxID=2292766 RepID=UPI00143D1475|nr:LTA synthase family protein [Persicimonas caeni]